MFNKEKIQPKTILNLIIIIWIVFSIIYIGKDIWSDFKVSLLNQAYQAGRTDTVNQLMTQAENKECQPFSVYSDQKNIQVINVACLTTPKAQAKPEANVNASDEENK